MERVILKKWHELKDEIMKSSRATEDADNVASLVAAVLTLADEVRQIKTKS